MSFSRVTCFAVLVSGCSRVGLPGVTGERGIAPKVAIAWSHSARIAFVSSCVRMARSLVSYCVSADGCRVLIEAVPAMARPSPGFFHFCTPSGVLQPHLCIGRANPRTACLRVRPRPQKCLMKPLRSETHCVSRVPGETMEGR